jgi:ferredoxin
MTTHLRLDPIACEGHGSCHELLPEMIGIDRWGHPVIDADEVPAELETEARRAVRMCPRLALVLERREPPSEQAPRGRAQVRP